LNEGFETGSVPAGWYYFTDGNGGSWSFSDRGAFGKSSFSAIFRNYDYDATGDYSDLRVKTLIKGSSKSKLTFDVAYAEYGGQYTDTLEVLISEDCGETFSSIYLNGGQTLATHPNTDKSFIPEESEWRTDTIEIPAFQNDTELIIAFRNHGHWGNNIYLDNININKNTTGVKDNEKINLNIFPNPVKAGEKVTVVSGIYKYDVKLFDEDGRLILSKLIEGKINKLELPSNLKSGKYYLNFKGEKHIANRVITIIK
jgi:hypothetical protein